MTVPFFVVNPTSGAGRLGKAWPDIAKRAQRVLGEIAFEKTRNSGDATRIARAAAEAGHRLIVSCGGDGTHNEVVNGLMADSVAIHPDLTLGLLPFGTGGDLRKTTGQPVDIDVSLRILADGDDILLDIGRLDFLDHDDVPASRYFVNIASAGLGGLVDMAVNKSSKRFGGRVSFFMATASALKNYTYPEVEIQIDDGPIMSCRVANVVVANGQFFGGGMHVAPEAIVDDGLFDVIVLHKTNLVNTVITMPDLYRGKHLRRPWMTMRRGTKVQLLSNEDVFLDVDGEAPGKLPATFTMLEHALHMRVDSSAVARGVE